MPPEWAAHEFRSSSGSIVLGPAILWEGGLGVEVEVSCRLRHAYEG